MRAGPEGATSARASPIFPGIVDAERAPPLRMRPFTQAS